MADYGKSRFGFRSKSSDAGPNPQTSSVPEPDLVSRPVIIGPDERSMPELINYPRQHYHHHYKETVTTTVKESAYRVQPVSPHTKDEVSGDRKMGLSEDLFHRPRTGYGLPGPSVITEGGWARPGPTGWKLPPEVPPRGPPRPPLWIECSGPRTEGRLSKVINDVDTAAEYLMGPMGSASAGHVGRWAPTGRPTIDSGEAVERYGGQYI